MMFDTILKGGRIIDGTGSSPERLDIGIKKGVIAAIDKDLNNNAASVLDISNLFVSPGFIDVHSHCDLIPFMSGKIRHTRLLQGVTTEIVGQCGLGAAPYSQSMCNWKQYLKSILGDIPNDWNWPEFSDYLKEMSDTPKPNNVASLVTHGAIRASVIGLGSVQPDKTEMKKMQDLALQSMESGAIGISYGLVYLPGVFAQRDEIAALSKIAAMYDGIVMIHIRSYSNEIRQAMNEILQIAKETGIKLQISHLKSYANRISHVSGKELIQIIENARSEGIDVTFDEHPYTAGSTLLNQILPPWAKEGGSSEIVKRMQDPDTLDRLRSDLSLNAPKYPGWDNHVGAVGWSNILVNSVKNEKNIKFQGKTMDQISDMMGTDEVNALSRLLVEGNAECSMVTLNLFSEQDIIDLISHPLSQIGSDGIPTGTPHPRLYSTFPKFIGHYIRDLKLMDLSCAIKKITGDPALRLNIKDRGLIKVGLAGDIVVFDLNTINGKEDYAHPDQIPSGIKYVFVNGKLAVNKGKVTTDNAGVLISR